ncbi:MAG: 3-hydroxyacyl-CoA dehydrogenase family protein [Clostridium sp.]|nr:3-hydroxyacyl-CoA dehydrogenase family protein [Clostridium sp.]
MGLSIAQFFAMNGHKTSLYNRTPENLDKAVLDIKNNLNTLLDLGSIKEEDIEATMENLEPFTDLKSAVKDADLVIESVSENVDLKKKIFESLDKFCRKDTILSSDTSSLNIYDFLEVSHPERVLITHFFNPAYVMPLVEIVKGPETSDEVVNRVYKMLKESGKDPAVLNKVVPGFIVNRLSVALAREAMHMVDQGWTTPQDIDSAISSTFGVRYPFEGHFELFDFVGLDVASDVINLLMPELYSGTDSFKILEQKLKAKDLGVKSGKGFKEYGDADKARRERDKKIIKVMEFVKTLE